MNLENDRLAVWHSEVHMFLIRLIFKFVLLGSGGALKYFYILSKRI